MGEQGYPYEPLVCILVLNWNGYEVTTACVTSLQKIYYNNKKIIIVDNGSIDGSGDIFKDKFQDVDVLALEKNYGYAGGNNRGITFALGKYKPDYILILNNDTVVEPNFLSSMVKIAEKENNCAAVVPKIFYFEPNNVLYFAGGALNRISGIAHHYGKHQFDSAKYSNIRKVTLANGCSVLLKVKLLQGELFFDERFFANIEDVELSLRILKRNYDILYQPNAILWHKEAYSTKKNNSQPFRLYLATRNIILMQRRHLSGFMFPIFLIVFLIRWVFYLQLKAILTADQKSVKSIMVGFIHGFSGKLINVNSL